jgi:diamine N-acetyltransferase
VDQYLVDRINEAEMPQALKFGLTELMERLERLLPELSIEERRPIYVMRHMLVWGLSDAENPTDWWEVALRFFDGTARDRGPAGQPVLDAAAQLGPLLRKQLGPLDGVTLREITAETVRGICMLTDTLSAPKKYFVASNAVSLAQAHFNPHAWFRAVYAGPAPVGFLMLEDDDTEQAYFLWRFMIAEPYHGRGYGREAIQRLVEYVLTRPGATALITSCGQGEGSPEGFYVKLGFEPTGDVAGHEIVLRLPFGN